MRKVILYIAASLDNFIATTEGGVDWLNDPEFVLPDEDYGYTDLYRAIDTTLMGYNTYRFIVDQDVPFPYPEKKNYVFSRAHAHEDNEFVEFIQYDISGFVRELKQAEGAGIWLVGGGQINTWLLKDDLIDEVILTLVPITLGEGIPLFHGRSRAVKFGLRDCKHFESGLVQLALRRKITGPASHGPEHAKGE
jgi:dihydrofolate reductase